MTRSNRVMFERQQTEDETDSMPRNIAIPNYDIFLYGLAIVMHFIDLGFDINIVVRYYLAGMYAAFGCTLVFMIVPALINTTISMRMYSMDKKYNAVSELVTQYRRLRIFALVLLLAPVIRLIDTLIYALKSRAADQSKDQVSQRHYYTLMLKEHSDAALLRIFDGFLECAPQLVLQISLLYLRRQDLAVHQGITILSSIIGLGWCLASYQSTVRYVQENKLNMDWVGKLLQTLWHFLVSLSRIISLSTMAYLYPYWLLFAVMVHVLIMTTWLQFYDKNPFCSQSKISEIAFSFALGCVYVFTYILPVEKRTRYRFTVFYTLCFVQNFTCATLWWFYADEGIRSTYYFKSVPLLCIVPYVFGIGFMLTYYGFFHPKVRLGARDNVKMNDGVGHI